MGFYNFLNILYLIIPFESPNHTGSFSLNHQTLITNLHLVLCWLNIIIDLKLCMTIALLAFDGHLGLPSLSTKDPPRNSGNWSLSICFNSSFLYSPEIVINAILKERKWPDKKLSNH